MHDFENRDLDSQVDVVICHLVGACRRAVRAAISWIQLEDGQTLAEYGAIITVIAIVVIVVAALIGNEIFGLFNSAIAFF